MDEISNLKAIQADLAHRVAQLTLLNQAGKQLSALSNLNDLLDRAAQLVQTCFNYHHVGIFLKDEERGEWVMRARAGGFIHFFPEEHRIRSGLGMVGWVASQGKKLLTNDVRKESHYINYYPGKIPTCSELSVPIKIEDEVVGVLDIQSPEYNAFNEGDVLVMETLADQMAVAIANSRLYSRLQQELAERERIDLALRAALQEKDLLLKEVHHRVKNNLQMVSSMLSLRGDGLEDPQAVQAFQDCQSTVFAISMVHKILYESSNLTQIDAGEYISELSSYLFASVGREAEEIQLHMEIEPIAFNVEIAISCGLMINELLTNILKYAFPPERRKIGPCEAAIILQTIEEKQCRLVIRDNGIGLGEHFNLQKTNTLGLQLINLLVRQIKGSIQVDRVEGTQFTIVFPIGSASGGD